MGNSIRGMHSLLGRALLFSQVDIINIVELPECEEKNNSVCNFRDCPCKMNTQPKYKTFGEEMRKGRFLNEIQL